MSANHYRLFAERLNTLPNGFPPTDDGAELRLLEKICTPEEAELASQLRLTFETPEEIATRLGRDVQELKPMLKQMVRHGVISAGKAEQGLGYGLLPFVVGIYEYQIARMDAELAELFEDYYQKAFQEMLGVKTQFHRVIPVNETVRNDMEIHPYESATSILNGAQSWGVLDRICRVQKKLVGDPCDHPVDVCMTFSERPGAYDGNPVIKAVTHEEALATLQRAADAGLVHSVSNSQDGNTYICNCCTCSCGILRGMAETGIANVVARSAFVNTVDPDTCAVCETCIDYCQFDALELGASDEYIQINTIRCVGCGVCVPACPDEALTLVRRPEDETLPIPVTHDDWLSNRAMDRGIDLQDVL